jgi:membrane associated rhomboid family serine protease
MKPLESLRKPFRYSFGNATLILILINVVCFIGIALLGEYRMIGLFGVSPVGVFGHGYVWQIFTYMFCHGSVTHIVFNMLGLYMFGTQVERRVGSREFLLFYLLIGLLIGAFLVTLYYFIGPLLPEAARNDILGSPTIGASGALYALLLAYAVFFPDSKVYLLGIIPLRAPVMVLGFTAIELALQLFFRGGDGVSHLGHLAGFGFAFIYFLVRYGINPWKRFFLRDRGGRNGAVARCR